MGFQSVEAIEELCGLIDLECENHERALKAIFRDKIPGDHMKILEDLMEKGEAAKKSLREKCL